MRKEAAYIPSQNLPPSVWNYVLLLLLNDVVEVVKWQFRALC